MDADVLIVGAGPSATAAAARLRAGGLSVLMLDRRDPPPKPCAGGLTVKTLDLMPWSVAPVIERLAHGIAIGIAANGRSRLAYFAHPDPICAFAVRGAFDRLNLDRALAAGAALEPIGAIDSVEPSSASVTLTADGRRLSARYLIGADGANSIVRRLTVTPERFSRGFALEGLVPYADIRDEPKMELFFNVVRQGYGWLFPKGDHVNVGIYTADAAVPLSKDALRAYARTRLGTDRVAGIKGYPLGFGGRHYRPAHPRLVLVGDAGGWCDPLLGEGIHNAVKTGLAAADAILDVEAGRTAALPQAFHARTAPVRRDLRRCDRIAFRLFYPHATRMTPALMGFPWFRYAAMKGFAAGKTTSQITNGFLFASLFPPSQAASLRALALSQGTAPSLPLWER
jgi:flavin-dependent dehydrogenase